MKQIFIAFCTLLCIVSTMAQPWQTTIGSSMPENKWAVIEDKTIGRFVTIGNSINVDNVGSLWIASYSPNGVLLSSALANNSKKMIARDICLAPSDPSTPNITPTYYVTGWTISTNLANQVSQSFVGRMTLNGVFLWYRESPVIAGTSPLNEEGVAVATAPNGDVVFAGHVYTNQTPGGAGGVRIKMARFTSTGAQVWSNVYNSDGNWKVREITKGTASPNCPTPTTTPGEFLVVGDATINTASGASQTQAFCALYNGAGTECWKSIYPAQTTSTSNITGSGAYDAALGVNEYVVAGVAQYGGTRGSTSCTPYFYRIDLSGALKSSAVYTNPNNGPLGLYPRCLTFGSPTDASAGKIVSAGPSFSNSALASISLDSVGGNASIKVYPGNATANTGTGPFYLDDGPSEGILFYNASVAPGFVISTNAFALPGVYGNGDAHLVRTDINLNTPLSCSAIPILSRQLTTGGRTSLSSTIIANQWMSFQPTSTTFGVQQVFCKDACTVTAAYTYTTTGNTVVFSGTGTGNGTLSYKWIFGDGTTANTQNATKTFPTGTYNVCLLVSNVFAPGDTCRTESCKSIVIANPCSVKAGFRDSLICGKKVKFINTSSSSSTTAVTYKWTFDDTIRSTSNNPTISFTKCGLHKVRLIVCTNNTCCDTIIKIINIPCCELKPDFCLKDSGRFVTITYDKTLNGTTATYAVFLDGVATSWTSGSKKQLTVGAHTICLKVSKVECPGDTCCATCCKTITVSNACTMVADFWYQVQSNGKVVFTNKTNATNYTSEWNLGVGSGSTVTSPTQSYNPGTYFVCLTTTSINGSDTCISRTCKRITIEAPCVPLPKFGASYCLGTPLTVQFTNPVSTSPNTNFTWYFGDGESSTSSNPTHTYASPGTYSVCMYNGYNDYCGFKSCYSVIVSPNACNNICDQLPTSRDGQRENPMAVEIVSTSQNGVTVDHTEAFRNEKLLAENEDQLSIYPNPASQQVQVLMNSKNKASSEITILNSMGGMMYKKPVSLTIGKNTFSIPIQNLAGGNYFLRINAGEKLQTAMFTVKK